MRLLFSPFGNLNFPKKTEQSIATEWTPHSVLKDENCRLQAQVPEVRERCAGAAAARRLRLQL